MKVFVFFQKIPGGVVFSKAVGGWSQVGRLMMFYLEKFEPWNPHPDGHVREKKNRNQAENPGDPRND